MWLTCTSGTQQSISQRFRAKQESLILSMKLWKTFVGTLLSFWLKPKQFQMRLIYEHIYRYNGSALIHHVFVCFFPESFLSYSQQLLVFPATFLKFSNTKIAVASIFACLNRFHTFWKGKKIPYLPWIDNKCFIHALSLRHFFFFEKINFNLLLRDLVRCIGLWT